MKNFFAFLSKYHKEFLAVILQALCLSFFFITNSFQRSVLISSSNQVVGEVYAQKASLTKYFNLIEQTDQLAAENAVLRSKMKEAYYFSARNSFNVGDSVSIQQYKYTTARTINATTKQQSNFITLNKGKNQGIERDMGVISPEGLVGVVVNVSENFSTVQPIINRKFQASVEVKRTQNFGVLSWDGVDPRFAKIEDIANHARIVKGDTIVTMAASKLYPTGIMVGIVDKIEQPQGDNYLDLTIKLSVDFTRMNTVYVVNNLMKREQQKLEEETAKPKPVVQ